MFSNALRVDDVIVAEGEWGRVEETTLFDGRTSVLHVTGATGGSVRVLVTAHDAPTLWDLRCYVREAMLLWIQHETPDAAPAQRILLAEASPSAPAPAEAKRPARGSKSAPTPEHASDEGLFTGSIQAVERASLFMHGEKRDASGGDDAAWQHNTDGLDSPVRD